MECKTAASAVFFGGKKKENPASEWIQKWLRGAQFTYINNHKAFLTSQDLPQGEPYWHGIYWLKN